MCEEGLLISSAGAVSSSSSCGGAVMWRGSTGKRSAAAARAGAGGAGRGWRIRSTLCCNDDGDLDVLATTGKHRSCMGLVHAAASNLFAWLCCSSRGSIGGAPPSPAGLLDSDPRGFAQCTGGPGGGGAAASGPMGDDRESLVTKGD